MEYCAGDKTLTTRRTAVQYTTAVVLLVKKYQEHDLLTSPPSPDDKTLVIASITTARRPRAPRNRGVRRGLMTVEPSDATACSASPLTTKISHSLTRRLLPGERDLHGDPRVAPICLKSFGLLQSFWTMSHPSSAPHESGYLGRSINQTLSPRDSFLTTLDTLSFILPVRSLQQSLAGVRGVWRRWGLGKKGSTVEARGTAARPAAD